MIEMVEPMERSCVRYAAKKLIPQKTMPLDKDEVMRLTAKFKREFWHPPAGVSVSDRASIVRAYLDAFGSMRGTELLRFGISPQFMTHLAKVSSWLSVEIVKSDSFQISFYSLAK
jgi:hypothetical protein